MFSIYITLLTSFANNMQVNMRVILTRLFGVNKLNFEDRHTRPYLALTPSLINYLNCRQANSKTKLAKSLKIMMIKDSPIVKALTCMNIYLHEQI